MSGASPRTRLLLILSIVLAAPPLGAQAALLQLVRTGTPGQIAEAVANGASVDARSEKGRTPLMFALAYRNSLESVRVLVDAGADVNARSDYGQTPLLWAAQSNESPAVVRALLDAGADPAVTDSHGNSAWDYIQMNNRLAGTSAYAALEALEAQ